MGNYKKYFTSTMFSGEIIVNTSKGYDTYEEAKANTDKVFPDVDWEEYNEDGRFITSSCQKYNF